MGQIKIIPCPIEGLYLIEPKIHVDHRGSFFEAYNEKEMCDAGLNYHFVQDNQNYSRKGTLRGLHYQVNFSQAKLARVIVGSVFDVAVDLRKNSPTYGKWFGVELNAENNRQILIPQGFAHGMLTLSEFAIFFYKSSDFWHPNDEGGILWNDPSIGIEWPGVLNESFADGAPLLISEKDRQWSKLSDIL